MAPICGHVGVFHPLHARFSPADNVGADICTAPGLTPDCYAREKPSLAMDLVHNTWQHSGFEYC